MNWNAKEIEFYLKEKDYIDTAVIPLLPVSFGGAMRQSAEQGEFVQLLSTHLERQFKGRLLLLPPFAYMDDPGDGQTVETLKQWALKAKENGFTHVFFLTSDKRWKELQVEDEASLFYVPSVPLATVDEAFKHSIMEDQLKGLMVEMIRDWQKE